MTEENIRISWDVENNRDIIYLPEASYTYYDTQGGAVEIGLDRDWLKTLTGMLVEWRTVTSYIPNAKSITTTHQVCQHKDTWFDRAVCPEPCGSMHNYCCTCSKRMEHCPTAGGLLGDLVYDGQDMNELCSCGHAAMVHTSGAGNCLALGTSSQEESHCLEFIPQTMVLGMTSDVSDDCCSDNCACGEVLMTPVDVCTACRHIDAHDAGGIGVCRADECGCDGPEMCPKCGHDANLHDVGGLCPEDACECYEPLEPCERCGHGTIHGKGTMGVFPQFCEVDGCNCQVGGGKDTECPECPHSWREHQQGDGGCPQCNCRVGETVKPPVISLCDECHGAVYTFPKNIVCLSQRMEGPNDIWPSFTYADQDGDELLISDGVLETGEIGVAINTSSINGVFVPIGALEAIISAIRESGHRAIITENE